MKTRPLLLATKADFPPDESSIAQPLKASCHEKLKMMTTTSDCCPIPEELIWILRQHASTRTMVQVFRQSYRWLSSKSARTLRKQKILFLCKCPQCCWVKTGNLSRDSRRFFLLATLSWNTANTVLKLRRAKGIQQELSSFESYRSNPTQPCNRAEKCCCSQCCELMIKLLHNIRAHSWNNHTSANALASPWLQAPRDHFPRSRN